MHAYVQVPAALAIAQTSWTTKVLAACARLQRSGVNFTTRRRQPRRPLHIPCPRPSFRGMMNSRTPFVPSARLLRHFQRNLSGITRPQQCTQSLRHQPVRTRLASKGQQVRHASASPNTSEWFRDVKNLWDHQMRENPILFPVALITYVVS